MSPTTTVAAITPPTTPAYVLEGEICTRNRARPNRRPARYAPVSYDHTASSSPKKPENLHRAQHGHGADHERDPWLAQDEDEDEDWYEERGAENSLTKHRPRAPRASGRSDAFDGRTREGPRQEPGDRSPATA